MADDPPDHFQRAELGILSDWLYCARHILQIQRSLERIVT